MDRRTFITLAGSLPLLPLLPLAAQRPARKTEVGIRGDGFLINGEPTYKGRSFNGRKVEGLLMNIRVVQGIFDDKNPETAGRWIYPDTKTWDPDRNTREFIAAMPEWRQHGVLGFTICLQGGSPGGAGRGGAGRGAAAPAGDARAGGPPPTGGDARAGGPPAGGDARAGGAAQAAAAGAATPGRGRGPAGPMLENTAINPDGSLRPEYMARLERILDRADELGMVAIVSYFYFGQDQRLQDEAAVKRAVVNATNWLLDRDYRHILVEVNNECGLSYDHEILNPQRVHELIELVKGTTRGGRRLLAATSWPGPTGGSFREVPDTPATSNVLRVSDFALIHGNGANIDRLTRMIRATRGLPGYRTMPVVINEDPNFNFDQPENNLLTSVYDYVSWGYYDQSGFQSPPVTWGINTDNKRQFFQLVKTITGA